MIKLDTILSYTSRVYEIEKNKLNINVYIEILLTLFLKF